MGSFPQPNSGDKNAQRRSQRVMLNASVEVLTRGIDNKLVSEETRTVVVKHARGSHPIAFNRVDGAVGNSSQFEKPEKKSPVGWLTSSLI